MRYRITHATTYSYDEPVTDSLGIGHLVPRELPWQQVSSFGVRVAPAPADLSHDRDYFGNTETYFQVLEPHTSLAIEATSEVAVSVPVHDEEGLAQPWDLALPLVRTGTPGAWRAADLALASDLVEQVPAVTAYAGSSLLPGRPIGAAVTELMHRIHEDFEYDPTATTVTTTVEDIFARRAGVCQDFAHLTLACLRSHGLAARYVSGYLATEPPPGKARVVGADASHAWAAVWVPAPLADGGTGPAPEGEWLALDPTNDQWVNDRYVTVAWGRDYADVTPLKGVIFTEAKKSTLQVSVDVAPAG